MQKLYLNFKIKSFEKSENLFWFLQNWEKLWLITLNFYATISYYTLGEELVGFYGFKKGDSSDLRPQDDRETLNNTH
jgi:hypothetical protein